MVAPWSFLLLFVSLPALAYPELSQQQGGVRISAPPRQSNLGILPIPDPAHPFRSPGHKDIRGPCPGLNTLANHGYLPRNGVASFEQIVNATTQAFNMDYDFASSIAAFGILARGNAYINKVSIGPQSPLVPPLPGNIDGPVARGLAAYGRFEGDVSMTRQDAAIGDNVNLDASLYSQLLDFVAQFGDDSTVTGPKSIVNTRVMQEFKYQRFLDAQAANNKLVFHAGRLLFSYSEPSFALNFFANGTTGLLSVPTMTSFFREQRFPTHWNRRQGEGSLDMIGLVANEIYSAHPISPGTNNASGVYIPDTGSFDSCSLYRSLAEDNVPSVLLNTTGLLKQNIDFLLEAMHKLFPDCPSAVPHGAANV